MPTRRVCLESGDGMLWFTPRGKTWGSVQTERVGDGLEYGFCIGNGIAVEFGCYDWCSGVYL